jgi:hypothetical protein
MDADSTRPEDEQPDCETRPNSVLITAEVADLVRDGLRSQIARSAQHIVNADGLTEAGERSENYQEPLRRIGAFHALLEALGWTTSPEDVRVDLKAHEWALTQAVRDEISTLTNILRDNFQDDECRATTTRQINALTPISLIVLQTQATTL